MHNVEWHKLAASVSGTLPRPNGRTSITGALYNERVLETATTITRCLSDAGVSLQAAWH